MEIRIVHPGTMAYPKAPPPTWETKAVKLLEPMNLRPAWATQKDITNQQGGKIKNSGCAWEGQVEEGTETSANIVSF